MARFLGLILCFLFSFGQSALTAYAPPTNSLTIAGMQGITAPQGANIMTLIAMQSANGGWSTYRDVNATSATGYTPSGSNKFYVLGCRVVNTSSSIFVDLELGYGNTDVGWNSGAAPTSPIYQGGMTAGGNAARNVSNIVLASAPVQDCTTPGYYLPNGKYLFAYWAENTSGIGTYFPTSYVFGYEAP